MAHVSKTRSHRLSMITLAGAAATLAGATAWMGSPAPEAPVGVTSASAPRPTPAAAIEADAARRAVGDAQARVEGAYDAPIGTRLEFDLDAEIGGDLAQRDGATQAHAIGFAGELVLTVLDRREHEAVVALRVRDAQLESPQATHPDAKAVLARFAQALAEPTLARVETSGRVTGYRFPVSFGQLEKSHLRAVLAGMRFIVPNEEMNSRQWTVLDRDDSGEFEAVYDADLTGDVDRELHRRRTRFTAPAMIGSDRAKAEMSAAGNGRGQLSADLGWLVAAHFDDTTTVAFATMQTEARSWCRGAVALIASSRLASTELDPVDWDGAWEPVGGDLTAAMDMARERRHEQWRRDLEGIGLSDLVSQLSALAASGALDSEEYQEAWERLARLFELNPEAAEQVLLWLAPGVLDDDTAAGVLTAMGCAGTEKAQRVLLEIQRNGQIPPQHRGTATIALMQIEHPTAETLAGMLESAGGEVVSEDLGRLSLMVLGTVAPRASGPLADGRDALTAIIALEERCRAAGTLDAWIHALGNSGRSEVAELATRYLQDSDALLREAAASAMRSARTPAAEQALIAAATRDASPMVRRQAAETLGEHGTAAARRTLCGLVENDSEAMVREVAMIGVANPLDAAGRAALQRAATHDPVPELRDLAQRLLTGA